MTRFEVGESPRVEVRFGRGRLRLASGEPGVVEVDVSGSADGLVVEQHNRTVVVREERQVLTGRSYNVTIRVPTDAAVDCGVATADVVVDATVRELRVSTATGDVQVREVSGRLVVKTASGDVEVDLCADAEVSTASGDVRLKRATGDVSCGTASGDMRIGACEGDLDARSVSGNVLVGRFDGRTLTAKTVSGEIEVTLPRGRRVRYELKSLSGRIDLPRPADQPTDEPKQVVTLRARTVSGDIIIRVA
jgi:DUF4097 and DUF4098 domain-containing protein YvlB